MSFDNWYEVKLAHIVYNNLNLSEMTQELITAQPQAVAWAMTTLCCQS